MFTPSRDPTSGLGALDLFPVEIFIIILRYLDMASHLWFGQVNVKARLMSTATHGYRIVVKYGIEAVRAIMQSSLGHFYTFGRLYHVLLTSNCITCGRFGGLLFLMTGLRCCMSCLRNASAYRMLPAAAIYHAAGTAEIQIRQFRDIFLHTISGGYDTYFEGHGDRQFW